MSEKQTLLNNFNEETFAEKWSMKEWEAKKQCGSVLIHIGSVNKRNLLGGEPQQKFGSNGKEAEMKGEKALDTSLEVDDRTRRGRKRLQIGLAT